MNHPEWLIDGPADSSRALILAHGAGQGMRSEFMAFFAGYLGRAGLRVVRFEFPYMVEMQRTGGRKPPNREPVLRESWHRTVDALLAAGADIHRLLVGGKSMGGRIASLIADERATAGLVCLGYPFHPPGKPDRVRIEQLQSMSTPTLICQGTRDTFGNQNEVTGYGLSTSARLAWIEDGDHSLTPRKKSGRTLEQNLRQAADAVLRFVRSLDEVASEPE